MYFWHNTSDTNQMEEILLCATPSLQLLKLHLCTPADNMTLFCGCVGKQLYSSDPDRWLDDKLINI